MNSESPYSSTQEQVLSWADRNGFAHWAIAMLWLVVVLILFQVVAGLVVVGLIFATEGMVSAQELTELMLSRVDLLFIGNSVGQILFIGLATFIIVNLNTGGESKNDFLRLKWHHHSQKFVLLGSLLIVVVQPVIVYLGYFNSILPIPDSFTDIQISQYQMIEDFLTRDGVLLFGLLNIALIPAICEEVLFRGYVLRAFEKSWGIITAIVVSGILFGLFHIQLGNILPLATLGMILAVMTWLSGSLWPAIAAHFINNGAAVLIGVHIPELLFQDISAESLPPVWLLFVSIIFTVGLIYVMLNQSDQKN